MITQQGKDFQVATQDAIPGLVFPKDYAKHPTVACPENMSPSLFNATAGTPWRECIARGLYDHRRPHHIYAPDECFTQRRADHAAAYREELIRTGVLVPLAERPTYRTDERGRLAAAEEIYDMERGLVPAILERVGIPSTHTEQGQVVDNTNSGCTDIGVAVALRRFQRVGHVI